MSSRMKKWSLHSELSHEKVDVGISRVRVYMQPYVRRWDACPTRREAEGSSGSVQSAKEQRLCSSNGVQSTLERVFTVSMRVREVGAAA